MSHDINIFNNLSIREPIDSERYEACVALWLEYRGSGISLDTANISAAATGINKNRLNSFNLYINIIKPIIDKENSTYVNPPTRIFKTKTGKDITKNLRDHIDGLLESMQYNTFMQKFETDAALMGTVLVRPIYNNITKTYSLVELTPADKSLKVSPDPFIKSLPAVVTYQPVKNVTISYDNENVRTATKDGSGQEVVVVEPHGFEGQPFSVLNFSPDNSVFWGPYDGTLHSFAKQRSLILANAMVGMHLSEAERLVVKGATWEEALKSIKDRMIVLPNDKVDSNGNKIEQSVDTLKPQYQEVINQIENYLKMYRHILDVRGHAARQFTVGADAMSAEAVRLGGIDMSQQVQKKRVVLASFEKALWKRIIWINNSIATNPTISADTELTLDFKPDPLHFSSAADEVTFFNATIFNNVNTPVDWIRSRQPELSQEEAIRRLENNTTFNDELSAPIEEPVVNDNEPEITTNDSNRNNNNNSTNNPVVNEDGNNE